MLLSSVIIILREVLEAALLFSVLLALTNRLSLSFHWTRWSLLAGTAGAILYAVNIHAVSEWFDGVGQEVVNAILQFGIYFMLAVFIVLMVYRLSTKNHCCTLSISTVMALAVSLALIREGFEIIIYLYSIIFETRHMPAVVMGAVIGASIGISMGILFYYILRNMAARWAIHLGVFLLILVASGMSSQASLLLIQADWLPSQLPLWDTNHWLTETSITGQLLYALVGYEATPTAVQASFYFGGLALLAFSYFAVRGLCGWNNLHISNEQDRMS